jgi:primary-amine oxidase
LICPVSGQSFEAVVDLPSNLPGHATISSPRVTCWVVLDCLLQPSLQPEELLWAEEICKADGKVKAACDAVGIDQQSIAVDGKSVSGRPSLTCQRLVHRSG